MGNHRKMDINHLCPFRQIPFRWFKCINILKLLGCCFIHNIDLMSHFHLHLDCKPSLRLMDLILNTLLFIHYLFRDWKITHTLCYTQLRCYVIVFFPTLYDDIQWHKSDKKASRTNHEMLFQLKCPLNMISSD